MRTKATFNRKEMPMTRKWIIGILVGVAVAALVSVPAMSQMTAGQRQLMAKRAAQADAYRQLGEEIKGIKISSDTYVRDYVAESDQISTELDAFIKGLKMTGRPRYLDDGSCEVDVQVTLKQLIQALKTIQHKYPSGKVIEFDQMIKFNKKSVIKATGIGVAPGEETASDKETSATSGRYKPWAGVKGWEDVTTQGRLLAQRAALSDGRRNLAETVKGLRITSNTYVRDFVVESDVIQTDLDAFIKGIKQVGGYRYEPNAIVECDVEVAIQKVIKELTKIRQQLITQGHNWHRVEFRDVDFEKIVGWGPKKMIKATGTGTVPPRGFKKGAASEGAAPSAPSSGPPAWASKVVTATGTGVVKEGEPPTLARLNAERAAELDTERNPTEKVYGVHITATTTVRDYVTEHDEVSTDVKQFLAGASRVGEPKYGDDGSVEVTMQLPLESLAKIVR